MHNSRCFIALLIAFSPALLANINATNLDNYQCSFAITGGQQSVRIFTLNADIYNCLTHSHYADMILINAEQQAVPFKLTTTSSSTKQELTTENIAFYQEPAAASYKTGDQIRRLAQLTGTSSGQESDQQWQDKNVYYSSVILEQTNDKDTLKNIAIHTKAGQQPVSATVVIEASDDLHHWKTLLSPRHLYFLPGKNGEALTNNTLDVIANGATRYLRFAALSNIENFTQNIINITGEYEKVVNTPPPLQWLRANDFMVFEQDEWQLQLPGLLPVSRIRFTPADNIVYYQGAIYIEPHSNPVQQLTDKQLRDQSKKKIKRLLNKTIDGKQGLENKTTHWRYLAGFTQYRLYTEDGTTSSPDIRISTTQSKTWKFNFTQPQNITAAQLPDIQLGWQPAQVTFIAQGTGPFKLLAGNIKPAPRVHFPNQLTVDNDRPESVELSSTPATPEPPAKDSADTSDSPFNVNSVLLWTILLIGVGVMAGMAWQLARKMQEQDS